MFSLMKTFIVASALSLMAEGQIDRRAECELHVSVRNSSGQPVRASLLLIGTDQSSRTNQTGSSGDAGFVRLPADDYTLIVRLATGKEIEERISTANGNCMQTEMVRVNSADEGSSSAVVFVADLRAPKKAKKLYEKGVSQLRRQHWQTAEELFEKAIKVYPDFPKAYNGLGIAATENRQFELASTAFQTAIRLHKDYPEVYLNFAKALMREHKFGEAELLLDEFLASDPGNGHALNLLAQCLFEQQEFDAVLTLVREVHAKHYAHGPVLHECAAEVYRQRRMTQEFEKENAVLAAESRLHP
jgi:tetratricopeptide (TPR) repeat protein